MYNLPGGITLTKQALGVFIVSMFTALVSLFAMRSKPQLAVGVFILLIGTGSYATYLTNCTVVGKCEKLAWFLLSVNVISTFVVMNNLRRLP